MSIPYILFFSNGCPHSTELIQNIRHTPVSNELNYFCVDGVMTLPDYVQFTPTLRIDRGGDKYIIKGSEIYEWLNAITPPAPKQRPQSQKQKQQKSPSPLPDYQQQQRQQHAPPIQEEAEMHGSYQDTTGGDSFDSVFSGIDTQNPEEELDAMFATTPKSTRSTGGTAEAEMNAKLEALQEERNNLELPPRQ